MATLLYYVPGVHAKILAYKDLAERYGDSLAHLEGAGWDNTRVESGPDGGKGVCINLHPARDSGGVKARSGYRPDQQRWHRVELEGHSYWIGQELERPPGPEDLQRAVMLAGEPVELCGGGRWTVPIVSPPGMCTLPMGYRLTAGAMELAAIGYDALRAESQRWADWAYAGITEQDDEADEDRWRPLITEGFRYAAALLAVNYRVGLAECSADVLGLLDTTNVWNVVTASLGFGAVLSEAEAKKKDATPPNTSSTSPGDAG